MHKECFPAQGWRVLASVRDIMNKRKAVLAGGTALALHIGHRESVDLDFFTCKTFRTESVISEIRETGKNFRILSEDDDHITAEIEGVKVSLFRYEYRFVAAPETYAGISIAGIPDIAAMKIIAISQRGTKRDFVDAYYILREMPFHKVAESMVLLYGKERINPLLIGKALAYFADADHNPEPKYIGKGVKWERVKDFFRNHARQFVYDLSAALKQ
jgi:hypothetical protein